MDLLIAVSDCITTLYKHIYIKYKNHWSAIDPYWVRMTEALKISLSRNKNDEGGENILRSYEIHCGLLPWVSEIQVNGTY